jgi:hypothetical protein
MSGLERWYRRLLAWYPRDHRRMYEDEMFGVLLDGARPGQRYPGRAETVDLLRSALWLRFGRTRGRMGDPQWTDAAAVVGAVVPVLLFTYHVRHLLLPYLWSLRFHDHLPMESVVWVFVLGWAVVAVAALFRWRAVAALLAWAATLAEVVALAGWYPTEPVTVLYALWPLVLGVTAAAALSVPRTAGRALPVLGRRRYTVVVVATLVGGLAAVFDPLTAQVILFDGGFSMGYWGGTGGYLPGLVPGSASLPARLAELAAAGTVLVALARTAAPLRRRLLALIAPAAVLVALISQFYAGFATSSVRFDPPVLLEPEQWVVLAVTPLATLLVGVALVHRRERRLHLIRLGEAAERDQVTAEVSSP